MKSVKVIYWWALLAIAVCGYIHIAIGADPLVPLLATSAMILGIAPLIRYGPLNLGSVLIFLVAFRYVGFSIFAKLGLGQALDTNLDQPLSSFAAVAIGVFAYFMAFMIINEIDIGLPLLRPVVEPRLLLRVSFIAFVIGIAANLEYAFRVNLQTESWTISSFFMPFLHLALISATASAILKSNGHRILDGWVLVVLVVEVIFAFVQNSRATVLEAILALAITDVAFRGKFTKNQVAITMTAILLLILITPVFLFVRGFRDDLNWKERISSTVRVLGNWKDAEAAINEYRFIQSSESGFTLRYYGVSTNYFERMSLVNNTDVLINGVDRIGHLGFEVVDRAIKFAMPRLLVPDKPVDYSEGDWMHYIYVGDYRYGGFLSTPLIGAGYVSCGWFGVFVFPFIIGFGILFLVKKAAGIYITGNIWSVYMLLVLNNQFVEGGTWSNVAIILRQIPQDTIVMLFIASIAGANCFVCRNDLSGK
jgi:hypothetical protein